MLAHSNASSPNSASAAEILVSRMQEIASEFRNVAFASSLGAEDMVLTDAIFTADLPIAVFTLDTGRLPRETLDLLGRMRRRYSTRLKYSGLMRTKLCATCPRTVRMPFMKASSCASVAVTSARWNRSRGHSRVAMPGSQDCAAPSR